MADMTLRLRIDDDYIRLVAYRMALEEIASAEPWASSDAREIAQAALNVCPDRPPEEPTP